MRSSLRRLAAQLELVLDALPRRPFAEPEPSAPGPAGDEGPGQALLRVLRSLGLRGITRCRLTGNRRVMVSWSREDLRVHRSFVGAPPEVLHAIVVFVNGRGAARRRARRMILDYPVERDEHAPRRERTHPGDTLLVTRLTQMHARFNERHFGGTLRDVDLRVSRRMTARLGTYRPAAEGEAFAEIAISRRHIRRHGWEAAFETLLHEMVHQWQDEAGLPLDHRRSFRRKAREVGIPPAAARRDTAPAPRGRRWESRSA